MIGDEFKMLFDAFRKMLDQSYYKSKDLADMLRFLPWVIVQKNLGKQGMSDLYRIKPNLLERLIKTTIEPLRSSFGRILLYQSPLVGIHLDGYTLDDYLCSFLQDRDRSQLYYCDPMHQQISICRHILSFMGGSGAFDFQSYWYVFRLL